MMVRRAVFLSVLVFAVLCGPARVPGQEDDPSTSCDVRKAGLDPVKFHLYLTKDTPYTAWDRLLGKNDPLSGSGNAPHGVSQTAYMNPVARRSLEDGKGMAFGSVLVSEDRGPDGKLLALSVMLKIRGYHPAGGDWHWFRYDAGGAVLACGREKACIECHGTRRENDYVMTAPVKK